MNLTSEERAFLRHLIAEHREYYGMLSSHPRCTAENRQRFHFLNQLWLKLGEAEQIVSKNYE